MNAKDYLNRYQKSKQNIDFLQRQIDFIFTLVKRADDELCKAGIPKKKREKCLSFYNKETSIIKSRILHQITNNLNLIEEIVSVIDSLENEEYKQILTYKFINGYTYDEISTLMYMSRSTMYDYYNKALDLVQKEIYKMRR